MVLGNDIEDWVGGWCWGRKEERVGEAYTKHTGLDK